jgi:hypothetical protein
MLMKKWVFTALFVLIAIPLVFADPLLPNPNPFEIVTSFLFVFLFDYAIDFATTIIGLRFIARYRVIKNIRKILLAVFGIAVAGLAADYLALGITDILIPGEYWGLYPALAPSLELLGIGLIAGALIAAFDALIFKYYFKFSTRNSVAMGVLIGIVTNPVWMRLFSL